MDILRQKDSYFGVTMRVSRQLFLHILVVEIFLNAILNIVLD